MLQFTNNEDTLTPEEIRAKYPDCWVGLRNIITDANCDMYLKSAVVVCFSDIETEVVRQQLVRVVEETRCTKKRDDSYNLTMLTIPQLIE